MAHPKQSYWCWPIQLNGIRPNGRTLLWVLCHTFTDEVTLLKEASNSISMDYEKKQPINKTFENLFHQITLLTEVSVFSNGNQYERINFPTRPSNRWFAIHYLEHFCEWDFLPDNIVSGKLPRRLSSNPQDTTYRTSPFSVPILSRTRCALRNALITPDNKPQTDTKATFTGICAHFFFPPSSDAITYPSGGACCLIITRTTTNGVRLEEESRQ